MTFSHVQSKLTSDDLIKLSTEFADLHRFNMVTVFLETFPSYTVGANKKVISYVPMPWPKYLSSATIVADW